MTEQDPLPYQHATMRQANFVSAQLRIRMFLAEWYATLWSTLRCTASQLRSYSLPIDVLDPFLCELDLAGSELGSPIKWRAS